MYDTYRFKDKDPVIDIVRTCVDIYAATNNMSFAQAIRSLNNTSGVSQSCMWNWFAGYTKYPRFATITAVVHATGREVKVSEHGMGSRKRFRVISGGKVA